MLLTNKILIVLLLFFPIFVFAYTNPGKPTGFVNDFASMLTSEERINLESKAKSIKDNTGYEVAIAIIKSLEGDIRENYAVNLFKDWGIGEKGKDNGILILVSKDDREVKIETGYGTEAYVTDLQAGNIIREVFVPAFQTGKYYDGLSGTLDAINGLITNDPSASRYSETQPRSSQNKISWEAIIFIIFILLNVFGKILGKTKSWWLGGIIGCGIGVVIGLIFGFLYAGISAMVILGILGLIFDYFVSKGGGKGGHGGMWFGGFGGKSGGFGGGFGGFGGGMSGGGGAGGRW